MGGLARKIPITFATFAVATAAIAGIPPLAGFFSKDEILWFAFASERGGSPLLFARGGGHRAADRVLHVPPAVAHVLRRARAWTPRGRAPRARVAAVDDRRARRAGGAVGGRRLPVDTALPRAAAAAARGAAGAASTCETPLVVVLGRARARSDSRAAAWLFGGNGARADASARARFAALHRLLSGKYFVDELYDRLHRRGRCTGSPDASSCASATARSSTARSTGSQRSRRRTAGVLGRVADRQPAAVRAASCCSGSSACCAWSGAMSDAAC